MPQAPFAPRKDADELIAECRATLLSTVEETFRAMRMSDDAWLATARSAAGQRFDELSGIRDRRGFEIARGLTASRISLIHEEDLDFSIELTELARHLHDRLEAELIPLSQRMRIILSQTEVIPEQLPQGPETACEALRALAGAAGLETEARMKLLERLREPLAQHLGALYERQNKRLDEAGIKTSHAPLADPRKPAPSARPSLSRATRTLPPSARHWVACSKPCSPGRPNGKLPHHRIRRSGSVCSRHSNRWPRRRTDPHRPTRSLKARRPT